jgi:hypothetical protein
MVLTADLDASVELDLNAELDSLTSKVRALIPASCCPHDNAPCLSCGLDWLVKEAERERPW